MKMFQANGLVWVGAVVCLLVGASLPTARAGRDGQQEQGDYESNGGGESSGESVSPNNVAQPGDLLAGKQLGDLMTGFMGSFLGGAGKLQSGGGHGHSHGHGHGHGHGEGEGEGDKKGVTKGGFEIDDWVKLMFNPVELIRAICKHFKLDFDKTSTAIGKPMVFGYEAVLTPLVVTAKIVEKVFVPDACKLLFVCKMGHHLEFIKIKVLKLNTKQLEGSQYLKAFTDGLGGCSCEEAFSGCSGGKPKLNKKYEDMRQRSMEKPQSIDGTSGTSEIDIDIGTGAAATAAAAAAATEQPQVDGPKRSASPAGAQKPTKATVNRISAGAAE